MNNKVWIMGRLVKDPEVIETKDGKKVSNITIASQKSYKNKDGKYDADFISCTLWESNATNTAKYNKKGDRIAILGHLESNSYEKDGNKIYTMEVIAETVNFLDATKDNDNDNFKETDEMVK